MAKTDGFNLKDINPAALEADKPRKRRIIIHESHDASEPQHVDIGVNGRMIRAQRGVEIELTEDYVGVLRNAVIDKTIQTEDKGIITRPYPRFPFIDLGPVPAA